MNEYVLTGEEIEGDQSRYLCIWAPVSRCRGPVKGRLKAALDYVYPIGAASGPDKETLALWDARLAKGRVVGIGGSDARTHVLTDSPLTDDAAHDRKLLHSALERGRCFVSCDFLADAGGFSFNASTPTRKAAMGDDINISSGVKLTIKLPRAGYAKLIRDGSVWREGYGAFFMYTAKKPGVYRVEVYRKGLTGKLRPWIFSNPIYIKSN